MSQVGYVLKLLGREAPALGRVSPSAHAPNSEIANRVIAPELSRRPASVGLPQGVDGRHLRSGDIARAVSRPIERPATASQWPAGRSLFSFDSGRRVGHADGLLVCNANV